MGENVHNHETPKATCPLRTLFCTSIAVSKNVVHWCICYFLYIYTFFSRRMAPSDGRCMGGNRDVQEYGLVYGSV